MHGPANWAEKGLLTSQSFILAVFLLFAVNHRLSPLTTNTRPFKHGINTTVDQFSKSKVSTINRLRSSESV